MLGALLNALLEGASNRDVSVSVAGSWNLVKKYGADHLLGLYRLENPWYLALKVHT